MRRLVFAVEGQNLRKAGDFSGITAGSKGYLCCHFGTADYDWLVAKKAAVFNDREAVPLDSSMECMAPDEVTDGKSFKVQLVGQRGTVRMTTNAVLIEQVK